MTRKPIKAIYDLGSDSFGRRLELIVEGDKLTLRRHAACQRDNDVWLEITPLQAAEFLEVLRS